MATGFNQVQYGIIQDQPHGMLRLLVSESWDDVRNISNVTVELQLGSYNRGTFTHAGYIYVNGNLFVNHATDTSIRKPTSDWGWFTVDSYSTGDLAHDTDGNLTIRLDVVKAHYNHFAIWDSNCYIYLAEGTYYYQCHKNDVVSKITSLTPSVFTNGTLSLAVNRSNANYHHKVTYKHGDTTLYTSEPFATTHSLTVPRSWFEHDTTITTLPVTAYVQTYTSAACTTAMGAPVTASTQVNADSEMQPVIAAGCVTLSPQNTGQIASITGYVQGYSMLKATFDMSKINMSNTAGATVTNTQIELAGVAYSGNPAVTGRIAGAGTLTAIARVTDSRGRTATQTLNISVMEYAGPTLAVTETYRSDVEGNANDDEHYIAIKAISTFSSLNGQNSVTVQANISGTNYNITNGSRTIVGNNAINPDLTYDVLITALDGIGNTKTYSIKLPTRVWAMQFRPDAKGVAFGKAAEHEKTLELPPDWSLRIGDVTINAAQLQRLLEMIT